MHRDDTNPTKQLVLDLQCTKISDLWPDPTTWDNQKATSIGALFVGVKEVQVLSCGQAVPLDGVPPWYTVFGDANVVSPPAAASAAAATATTAAATASSSRSLKKVTSLFDDVDSNELSNSSDHSDQTAAKPKRRRGGAKAGGKKVR